MRTPLVFGLLLLTAGCGSGSTRTWLEQLKDADVVKRRQAIRELSVRSTEAERIVPALMEALHDENSYVRHDAAITLGKFGPDARAALPALQATLKDKEKSVRSAVKSALKLIDPEAAKNANGH